MEERDEHRLICTRHEPALVGRDAGGGRVPMLTLTWWTGRTIAVVEVCKHCRVVYAPVLEELGPNDPEPPYGPKTTVYDPEPPRE